MVTTMISVLGVALTIILYGTSDTLAGCGDLPHSKCERNYEKVGGFVEKSDRVMPELLVNDRDCSSDKNDGHKLDWYKFEESIHSLACRCAEIAKKNGYKVFGLQFYGECWSGPSAEAKFAEYGKAPDSSSWQLTGDPPPPCDKNNPQECVGVPWTNYVYRVKEDQSSGDINGGYSNWSDWTACSKTCGGGEKGRERTCTNPKPEGNGKDCLSLGAAEETAKCNEQACPDPPVDGKWSSWNAWSACSVTCGGGVRVRGRTCDNPAPSGNGKKCEGADEETGKCAEDPCPIPCTKALDIGIIIDESGSVGWRNFQIALEFINELITHYKVSDDGTHFGIITYNKRASLQFTMADSRYHDLVALKERVHVISYNGGWTRTDRALEMAASSLFTAAGGDRSDKPNILIVFTDGKTNRGSKAYAEVLRPLQEKGVRTVAVGIGRGIKMSELLEIAMDNPRYVVKVEKFEKLKESLDTILDDSCQGLPPPTPEPECPSEGASLGMENGKIPAASLSASSEWSSNYAVNNGRLNSKTGGGAWAALYNDKGQYFQIDFGQAVKITKILTQGRPASWGRSEWVKSYWLSYSQDNGVYEPYVKEQEKGKLIFEGNKNSNEIQSNKLDDPIFARYLRVHPLRWKRHISMRLEIYGCTKGFIPPVVPSCLSALGLQSGDVPDSRMTASSQWSGSYKAASGRLYFQKKSGRKGAWVGKHGKDQWMQVDLGKTTKVQMVGTQGRSGTNQWVINYWISYSDDGIFWQKTDIFTGNSDDYSVVRNLIDPPIYGRYFRIHPDQYRSYMSMRAEFYGCTSGKDFTPPKPISCLQALGMKDKKIPDASITASSSWNVKTYGPERARLGTTREGSKRGAWSAKTNKGNQWLQVKLDKTSKITSVATQGRQDSKQWVKTFTLEYSQDGLHFEKYLKGKEVILGNTDQNTPHGLILDPPIIARYIRVLPKSYHGHISMRMEVYGCTSGFTLPPSPSCLKPLGLEDKRITDEQMMASSQWSDSHAARNGRLNSKKTGSNRGAWSALRNNVYQWLGVMFPNVVKVTMFATQGRQDHPQWVKTYKLEYSLDGYEYKTYSIKGQPKIFNGNSDQNTPVAHRLTKEIFARYVRVVPLTWKRHISMRLEIYGCTEGFVVPSIPKCREPLGLQSGLIKEGQITASSEFSRTHRADNGRLFFYKRKGRTGGWSAKRTDSNQWLQVDFEKHVEIKAVATQGREDANQYVKRFTLAYSSDGIFWTDYRNKVDGNVKLFKGNRDRFRVVRHMLKRTIIARFIRIKPKQWHRYISMRAEFYGCRQGFPIPTPPVCSESIRLGDWMMSSSSYYREKLGPVYGKVGYKGGDGSWSARKRRKNEWLQVTFDHEMKVTGVVTQGRHKVQQWVKSYIIEYSQNGKTFTSYKEKGVVKLFQANKDNRDFEVHKLAEPIVAIALRLKVKSWKGWVSMRMGLYGCPTGKKPASPPCQTPMDVGIIMDRSGSIGSANFKKSQDFVMKMIKHFEYASSASRLGVIAYNSKANVIFKFNDKAAQNPLQLEKVIYGIKYLRGGTRTDRAISLANSHLYSPSGGYLSNRPNVLFVLTDGKTNRGSEPYKTVLDPLLKKKVTVIAVGVGKGIDRSELKEIANYKNKHVFLFQNFMELSEKLDDILKASCP